jgi:malic enzyme
MTSAGQEAESLFLQNSICSLDSWLLSGSIVVVVLPIVVVVPHFMGRRHLSSPVPPLLKDGVYMRVDQTNNSYVFPGIGLGAVAVRAHRISDGMLMAAARALADLSPSKHNPRGNLLPPVTELRDVSFRVAQGVAIQARKEGLTDTFDTSEIYTKIKTKMWSPAYENLLD